MDTDRLLADRYRLLAELGRGETGVVWQARDEALGRPVAVKEIRAAEGLSPAEVRLSYARLEQEAMTAGRVSHRNVTTVHNVVVEDGRLWIVMELVRGLPLSAVLEVEGALPPARAARIGAEAVSALRSAHEAGVVHRDLKPSNVLLGNDGRVVLTDFGIALVKTGAARSGEPVGEPEFLSPECARGQEPGPAADLWALGVLLYLTVEGVSPFRRDTPKETLRAVAGYVDGALPAPRRAGPLGPVVEGLLRADPAARMPAAEAERLLRVAAAGGAPRATPPPASAEARPRPAGADVEDGGDRDGDRSAPPAPGTAPAPPEPSSPWDADRGPRGVLLAVVGLLVVLLAALAVAVSLR
ncbi:protein kinase domain-containing protein [Streptomyces megasporus]|uniref:protein kinase domain-containing protein n=1 Tax=Streptomyces megasporus TaxID=44060 RepID=UPI0006921619